MVRTRQAIKPGSRALISTILMFHVILAAGGVEAAAAYPVKVGPTGRYLVDQNGVPFLIAGESPQAMIGNLSEADAELFLAHRRAQGFNTVWINLLCAAYTACRGDGRTFDGVAPFTVEGDFATPNEAYFARADQMLRLAAKYGFLVILDPAETGSWLAVMQGNGIDKCREYGRFLGKRYEAFDNILWMHGNDYRDNTEANDALVTAIAAGIREFDARHLHTVLLNTAKDLPPISSVDDERWLPFIEVNATYTYQPVYAQVLKDYNRPNVLPAFLAESGYEFEEIAVLGSEPRNLRAQAYWALLSGAGGQMYGNKLTWTFVGPWKDNLDTPGAVQMANVTALFEGRAWYELVPDQNHVVVTAGYGEFGSADYVTAARTPDGRLVMAYVPSERTLTVDMSTLSGPVLARWYDPVSGVFTGIGSGLLPNAGTLTVTTPGVNAGGPGNGDWVLVLETSSRVELTGVHGVYRSGEEFRLLLTALNGGDSAGKELYVGVLLPDGETMYFLTQPGVIEGEARLGGPAALRPLAIMEPAQALVFDHSNPVISGAIPAGLAEGVYWWFAAFVVPNSLGDNSIDSGDVEILSVVSATLAP